MDGLGFAFAEGLDPYGHLLAAACITPERFCCAFVIGYPIG